MVMQSTSILPRVVVVLLVFSAVSTPALAALDAHSTQNVGPARGESIGHFVTGELITQPIHLGERTTTVLESTHDLTVRSGGSFEFTVHHSADEFRTVGRIAPYAGALLRYSRYDGSDPLENEHRAVIYDRINDSPGIHVSKLSDETLIHRSTVRYHVRILDREGLIAEEMVRGKHRLYPVDEQNPKLLAALAEDATMDLLQAVERVEPVSVSGLAAELDRAPSTISYHLARLAEDDLVTRERKGSSIHTTLTADVRKALWSQAAGTTVHSDD